jgi:endonuclease/exonuclease/phosphatase family metal-dependent hydrolase
MKILSLNLNYYGDKHGPWERRKPLIAEAIAQHRPDVVALQAVRRDPAISGGVDQASQLADVLDEYDHVVFGPSVESAAGVSSDSAADGSAFLAKRPFQKVIFHRLGLGTLAAGDSPEDPNPRLVLAAKVNGLYLFNAHLSWVPAQAAPQVALTLPFIEAFAGRRLLVGDLNMPPGSELLHGFTGRGWTDLWAMLHPGQPGYTFESHAPDKRIDYAWVSPELRPAAQGIDVLTAASLPHTPSRAQSNGIRLSDHHGILVSLAD